MIQSRNTSSGKPCRCLVLTSRHAPTPGQLLAGLRQRGVQVEILRQPVQVMLELGHRGGDALIVHEPREVASLPELLAALRRYYPRVACWRYEIAGPDAKPQLARIEGQGQWAAPKEDHKHEPTGPVAQAQSPVPHHTQDLDTGHGTRDTGQLLTPEELSMLLGEAGDLPAPGGDDAAPSAGGSRP